MFSLYLSQKRRRRRIIRKKRELKKKGVKRRMPIGMLRDCIGKKVRIYIEGELGGFEATVLDTEENWIKVEEKKSIRILNGDMITQILISK